MSKTGTTVRFLDLSSFFVTGSFFISDPKVLYDTPSQRWFASIIVVKSPFDFSLSNVTIAVSLTSDPTGFWNIYRINTAGSLPDQPIIGISSDKFVVSANMFQSGFVGAEYWVLSKAELVSGASTIHLASFGPNSSQVSDHPVQSLSPTTTQYMVSAGLTPSGTATNALTLFSIIGVPPNTVTVNTVALTLSSVSIPPNGDEPSCSQCVVTDDSRVLSAAWFNGNLWFSLDTGCTPAGDNQNRACVRLTELSTGTSTIKQDFNLGSSGQAFYYPTLSIDGFGDLVVVYGYSSSTTYPSLAVTGQAASDPANSLASSKTLVTGNALENSGRYGDYFGAGVDPSDPSQVWVEGEYNTLSTGTCQGVSCWSTFIGSVRMVGFTISASPSSLSVATSSAAQSTITLTSLQSFSGQVSLSGTVTPTVSRGPSLTFNPSTISLLANNQATSTLTVTTGSRTPAGPYLVNVTASSGTRQYSTIIQLRVGSDYTLTANPASFTIAAGSSTSPTSTISLTGLNGFTGKVPLTASSTPSGPTLTLNPSSVNLRTGSGTSTLTISNLNTLQPGNYILNVTGSSGSISHTALIILSIVDFTLKSSPSSIKFVAGTSGTTSISLTSLGVFAGPVSLSASPSSGLNASFASSVVNLLPGFKNSTTLNLSASTKGNYTVTVTGSGGGVTHSVIVPVTVIPTFTMKVTPSQVDLLSGKSTTVILTLTSIKGFSGTVSLSGSNPEGSISFNPVNITLAVGATANSTVTVGSSGCCLFGNVTAVITGTSRIVTNTVNLGVAVGGLVCLADPSTAPHPPANECPPSSGFIFNGPLTSPPTQLRVGVYVNDTGSFSAFQVILKADHTILAPVGVDTTGNVFGGSGGALCVGGVGSSCAPQDNANTIDVIAFGSLLNPPVTGLLFVAIYNITGTTSGTPISFQTGCTQTSIPGGGCVTLPSGGTQPEIAFPITANFTNGSPAFATLSSSPTSLKIAHGGSNSSTITGTANNGHPGVVKLTTVQSTGLTVTFSSTTCDLSSASTCTVTMTVRASSSMTPGNYFVTVYATYTYRNSATGFTSTLTATYTVGVTVT